MDYHAAFLADVAQELKAKPGGLDAATSRQRLAEHGLNALADPNKSTYREQHW
jgi:Ca2+-transporting ATPase